MTQEKLTHVHALCQLSSTLDGHKIQILKYLPSTSPKAVVYLLHGMSEHAGRYHEFSQYLAEHGYMAVAHHQRGHGPFPGQKHGYFGHSNGWERLLSDVDQVQRWLCAQYDLPIILFGHSMGSFVAQAYCAKFSPKIEAMILSGSCYRPKWHYIHLRWLLWFEKNRLGSIQSSPIVDYCAFGAFNRFFKPNRTQADWLSRDQDAVDSYLEDPLCGFSCSTQMWYDLVIGMSEISDLNTLEKIPKALPIYIFGGDQDPMSRMSKDLTALAEALKHTGHSHTYLKLYPGGRHEMLHEMNRAEVFYDLLQWLEHLQAKVTLNRQCSGIE